MSLIRTLITASVLSVSFNASAALTSYTGAGGVGLVYSSISNITWTQDANLLGTLESTLGYSNAINAIIAANPTINNTASPYDTPAFSGHHTVSTSDFSLGGFATWFGAQAFVGYLNSISYGGSNQWSLPGWTDTGAPDSQDSNNGTDMGYNVNPSSDPLAQLYYGELNKTAYYNTSGNFQNGYGIFGNNGAQVAGGAVGPFSNVQSSAYWLGTEYAPEPNFAWVFDSFSGGQSISIKTSQFNAWAVSPGQVSAVPVPGAVWLMGSGLLGLLGLKRRGHAG